MNVLLALAVALGIAAQPASMSIGNGIVVAPSAGAVYLMDPKDGAVALDLSTGKQRWSAGKLAAKPLVQHGAAVLALDEPGAVRVLDAKTGKARAKCSTIPGITLQLFDGLGSRASSSGVSDGVRAWISWQRSTHYAGGAAPTPEQERASRTHSGGTYEIDLDACSQRSVEAHPFTPKPLGATGAEHVTPGGTTFRLFMDRVEREAAGRKLPDIPLPRRTDLLPMYAASADLRHVFFSDGEHVQGKGYAISIFEIDSGERIATASVGPFPLQGVLVGRLLVGGGGLAWVYDLDAQRQLWVRGVRSTEYAGPYPPSAPPRPRKVP